MDFSIRIAEAADREAWDQLRFQLWPDCPAERHCLEIEQLLASSGMVAFAVVENGVAGFIEVSIRVDHVEGAAESPIPYVKGWFVAASHRGRGIGRALFQFAERWALDHGYHELASDAELLNTESIRLHTFMRFMENTRR